MGCFVWKSLLHIIYTVVMQCGLTEKAEDFE